MLALKDYLVLNYLEWLKFEYDIDELFLQEENRPKLIKLTNEYIEYSNRKFKVDEKLPEYSEKATDEMINVILMNTIYDLFFPFQSIKFNHHYEMLRRYIMDCYRYRTHYENLDHISHDFRSFIDDAYYNLGRNSNDSSAIADKLKYNIQLATESQQLNYNELIESAKLYLYDNPRCNTDRESSSAKIPYLSDIYVVNEFLDYLRKQNIKMNVEKAPKAVINKYLNAFIETKSSLAFNKKPSSREISVLISKLKNKETTIEKMLRKINRNSDKIDEYKDLGYLFDRHKNNKIFKCLILPLKSETNLNDFYTTYWHDLDSLSSDYLDIYYSISQIDDSGYAIANSFFKGQAFSEKYIPCLFIWKDNIEDYEAIYLGGLSHNQIFKVIENVVRNIAKQTVLKQVKELVDEFISHMKEEEKPNMIVTQNIGTNYGVVGVNVNDFKIDFNLNHDLNKAIAEIEKLQDVDEKLIRRTAGILKGTQSAIKRDSQEGKKINKANFKKYILNAGEKANKIISVLANFATLATFFGLDQSF